MAQEDAVLNVSSGFRHARILGQQETPGRGTAVDFKLSEEEEKEVEEEEKEEEEEEETKKKKKKE